MSEQIKIEAVKDDVKPEPAVPKTETELETELSDKSLDQVAGGRQFVFRTL